MDVFIYRMIEFDDVLFYNDIFKNKVLKGVSCSGFFLCLASIEIYVLLVLVFYVVFNNDGNLSQILWDHEERASCIDR